MTKKYVKAFIAGMAFPALFLPLAFTALFCLNHHVQHHALFFAPMYLPLVFGIANMLYIKMIEGMPAKNANSALWTVGIFLGFIVALLGVFVIHVPTIVFGSTNSDVIYAPLIVLPLIYGIVFRYIVKWLNKLLSV